MGRDLAHKMFARTLAVLGLAAVTTIGLGSPAGAAPSDRPNDPVVLTGADTSRLVGAAPTDVVGFKWEGGWVQVPVQVDERHVISVRQLYPETPPAYVNNDVSFDATVYADAKTRSGADSDQNVDADDEIAFMGGDTGQTAPANTLAPAGVIPGSATKVDVSDTVGGGDAVLYLFESTGDLDQSAGKDYVQYDFKLTEFTPSMTLIDDYGFSNSNNPEDSTVKTANYELHSTDRWMEDEMKITAGGSPGTDILDREAVSAGGLGGCSRSEYTFSGNWNRGSDNDEGSIVAIKDGPVRAIRSYVGANSGPYVQSDHVYYADREDKTIRVRVHPIPEMYVWTDYNESALGMTYRDEENQAGVTIDGVPGTPAGDDVAKMDDSDFEDGTYVWQQVTGTQGTATTLVTAIADQPAPGKTDPPFTSYYLDDSTPSTVGADKERQCGGDMKAYGASGFGIDGTFPNTDPNLASNASPARKLSVNRVRYFGAPNQSAADASALRERVQKPLAASASDAQVKPRTAKVNVKVQSKPRKAKRGKALKVKVKVSNTGTADAKNVKVCVSGKGLKKKTCRSIAILAAGKSKLMAFSPKVKKSAKGRKLALKVSAASRASGSGLMVKIPFGR